MKQGAHIQLTKIGVAAEPIYPPGDPETYKYGQNNDNVSLPVEYTLNGVLLGDIRPGDTIHLRRYERNGLPVPGEFRTSEVVRVVGNIAHTKNSQYRITALPPLPL